MDQRTSAIDQDLKDIAQTRIAIAEKWDALEQQITHRVEDVTMTCSDMLNRATDNIGAFVNKTKAGKEILFINERLVKLLAN